MSISFSTSVVLDWLTTFKAGSFARQDAPKALGAGGCMYV